MKTLILNFICLSLFIGCVKEIQEENKPSSNSTDASKSKYSYTIPSDWEKLEAPEKGSRATGQKEKMRGVYRICIIDTIDKYDGSFESLIKSETSMMNAQPGLKNFSSQKFISESGIKGIKMTYEWIRDNRPFYQSSYIFDLGHSVQIFTCTASAHQKKEAAALFDRILKTLEMRDDIQIGEKPDSIKPRLP